MRRLEIGPGFERLPGFETLNAVADQFTDHVGDARNLPFPDESFDEVYSSHCIEHIEWHQVEATLVEWARVLKVGGVLEVHTVNAVPLMRAIIELEETGETSLKAGSWRRELHKGDPYLWAVGRIMNYRRGTDGIHWMHRAILTPGYMAYAFAKAGITDLEPVAEPKGRKKHRAINMGMRGVKK